MKTKSIDCHLAQKTPNRDVCAPSHSITENFAKYSSSQTNGYVQIASVVIKKTRAKKGEPKKEKPAPQGLQAIG